MALTENYWCQVSKEDRFKQILRVEPSGLVASQAG
jgi:hypothetical protein